MKSFPSFDKRYLLILLVIPLIFIMMDFNTRMAKYLSLNEEKKQVEAQVTSLAGTQQYLVTQIAFATSDAGVEKWAREEVGMVKEGEIPIVPLPDTNATPQVETTPAPVREKIQNWQVWQALFLGD